MRTQKTNPITKQKSYPYKAMVKRNKKRSPKQVFVQCKNKKALEELFEIFKDFENNTTTNKRNSK